MLQVLHVLAMHSEGIYKESNMMSVAKTLQ